jgi:putative membrane protein
MAEVLGTQGDLWDTQSDMLFALLGALTALVMFSRLQNRQIPLETAFPASST